METNDNKPILLVPMAGLGKRFRDKGFTSPKPFIVVDDKQIIDYSFLSIKPEEYYKIIFVVLREHVNDFAIDKILESKFGKNIEIVVLEELTEGSVCSCLAAAQLIDDNRPLVIYTLDVYFSPKFVFQEWFNESMDGLLVSFKSNSSNHSYAKVGQNGIVSEVKEKQVISNNALVGIYCFKTGQSFLFYAKRMIEQKIKSHNEYYLAPLYNMLIKDGLKVYSKEVEQIHIIGTPEEMDFFKKNVCYKKINRPIAICADHSGFLLKESFKRILKSENLEFIDFGCYSEHDCDYSDYVIEACRHVKEGFCNIVFGFCRSGQGVNITANKCSNMRAALVFDEYTAKYAIKHNCANFFSIPSKYVDIDQLTKILEIARIQTFDGGRHSVRLQKMENYENSKS